MPAATSPLVVTRFAPSPTGHLHIGGARSALFCWAFARRRRLAGDDGRFMIRIEDTDQARSSDESARGILEDLAWLGLDWQDGPELAADGRTIGGDSRAVGPYFQARRQAIYNRYIEQLVRAGRAYPAFERAEELDALRRAAVAAKRTYRYERPADVTPGAFNAERWARAVASAGEPHVVRFVAPAEGLTVRDEILGDVSYAAGEMDDFVIRKADGFPTYHFAVVVDDELMGVTHVLRAQEHLNNTPRHVALQRALAIAPEEARPGRPAGSPFRTPLYGHMPLICNMDGSKMSKRDKAKAARKAARDAKADAAALAAPAGIEAAAIAAFIAGDNDRLDIAEALAAHFRIALPEIEIWDFRRSGYLPEAIVNFIALLGWNPGLKAEDGKDLEKFDLAFIGEHFSLDRIGKGSAKFDRAKLLAFNAAALGAMAEGDFARRWLAWMAEHEPGAHAALARLSPGAMLALARALKPRAKTWRDALRPAAFALVEDGGYAFDGAAIAKHLAANDRAGVALLQEAKQRLAALPDWSAEPIAATIDAMAVEKGFPNAGPIAQALRVALTGTGVSPGLGETMFILGRESTMRRIDRCLSQV